MLFAEIADAYFECEMYAEAKPIHELLAGDPAVCQKKKIFQLNIHYLINWIYKPVAFISFFKQ